MNKFKVVLVCFVILNVYGFVNADIIFNNNLFAYDKTVNNTFVNDNDIRYTLFGGPFREYFFDFDSVDLNTYIEGGYNYGIGAETDLNAIYYFDTRIKEKIFGYNTDSNSNYIKDLGSIVGTSTGRIYAADNYKGTIFYWNIKHESYDPIDSLDRRFGEISDIGKDINNNIYIIDIMQGKIFGYSENEDSWIKFYSGNEYIDLRNNDKNWALPSGIEITSNGIYVSYMGGAIAKYGLDGRLIDSFYISPYNLGLYSSSNMEETESCLTSITSDQQGNIYTLDNKSQKVHIFTSNLDYISSWEDPDRPIEKEINDISFMPGKTDFFVTYEWGFHMYQKIGTISGITLSSDFIYPSLVDDIYRGLIIDLDSVGSSGRLDIVANKDDVSINIIENRILRKNEHFTILWDGKTKSGVNLEPGFFTVDFYFGHRLVESHNLEIKNEPRIIIDESNTQILSETNSLQYHYTVEGDAKLRIKVANSDASNSQILSVSTVTDGDYILNIDFNDLNTELEDGYKKVIFELLPKEFEGLYSYNTYDELDFFINSNELTLTSPVITSKGLNPTNDDYIDIGVSFSINESAYVTVSVIDENGVVKAELLDNELLSSGIKNLVWDGYNAVNNLVADGIYYFQVKVGQPIINMTLNSNSYNFILDTSAPIFRMENEADMYYISPNESSSMGTKDSINLILKSNEKAYFSAEIFDSSSKSVHTILSNSYLESGTFLELVWDGRNNESSFVEDGTYQFNITASDDYGNISTDNYFVKIDNNNLNEGNSEEQLFASKVLQVNSIKSGNQFCPAIATIDTGIILTWQSKSSTGNDFDIKAQRFDTAGNFLGQEFLVNSYDINNQERPSVVKIDNGFVITWNSFGQDGSGYGIYVQRFDNYGNKLGSEFRVNSGTTRTQLDPIVSKIDDGFVVTWESNHNSSNNYDIYAQRFSNSGDKLGPEFKVNTYSGNQIYCSEVSGIDSGFVITWEAYGQDGDNQGVFAQRYDNNGSKTGSEFQVNTYSKNFQGRPAVTRTNDGYIIIWISLNQHGSGYGLYAQRFDELGYKVGNEIRISDNNHSNKYYPEIASSDDEVIITWYSDIIGGSGYNINAVRMSHSGQFIGEEFIVQEFNINSNISNQYLNLAATSDNGFVISWQSSNDVNEYNVFAKKYDIFDIASGNNLVAEFANPVKDYYLAGGDFQIRGIASDINIDRYKLSINDNELISKAGENVSGVLFDFNILDAEEGVENLVKLEVWDKAGNYRSDGFTLTREYDSLVNYFNISSNQVSSLKPLEVNYNLKEVSNVYIYVKDQYNNYVKSFDLGRNKSISNHLLNLNDLADGNYNLICSVNHETFTNESVQFPILVDFTSPVIEIDDLSPYFNNESVLLNFAVTESNTEEIRVELVKSNGDIISLGEGIDPELFKSIVLNPSRYIEGNYIFRITVIDEALNSSFEDIDIIIDRTSPNVSFVSPYQNDIISSTITIDFILSDDNNCKSYIITYEDENNITTVIREEDNLNSEIFSIDWDSSLYNLSNGSIKLDVIDKSGNSNHGEIDIFIDNNAPDSQFYFSRESVINNEISYISKNNKLTLFGIDNDLYSTISNIQYKINNADEWNDYVAPLLFTEEGDYTIIYRAIDNWGNIEEENTFNFSTDLHRPEVSCTISDPKYIDGENIYISQNNIVTIKATDNESGLDTIMYSLDASTWITYDEPFKILTDNLVSLSYQAVDSVGNTNINTYNSLIIDLTPPQTIISISDDYYINELDKIIALKNPSQITLISNDSVLGEKCSGIKDIYYKINNQNYIYEESIIIDSNVPVKFSYYAEDNIGNTEIDDVYEIGIDDEAPIVNYLFDNNVVYKEGYIYSKSGNYLTLYGSDNFSGIKDVLYKITTDEYVKYHTKVSFNLENDFEFVYYAVDNVNNSSSEGYINISIDDTPPSTALVSNISPVNIDDQFYIDSRYEITFSAYDGKSGVLSTYIFVNDEQVLSDTLTFENDGTYNIEFYSIDEVGNVELAKNFSFTSPIPDITPPTSYLEYTIEPYIKDDVNYFTSDIGIEIKSEDIIGASESYASGVNRIIFQIDNLTPDIYTGQIIEFETGAHSLSFYSIDNVGNTEEIQTVNIYIDDNEPVSSINVPGSEMIYISDILYINESDKINIDSVDNEVGINYIYYRLGSDSEWIEYFEGFSLADGEYIVEFYGVDYLGHSETVQSINICIVPNYNIISNDKEYKYSLYDEVIAIDTYNDYICYISKDDSNHIYMKDSYDANLYSEVVQISKLSKKREDIKLNDKYIVAVEDEDERNIYLYDINSSKQIGQKLSFSGDNYSPIILEEKLYWINSQNGISNLIEYDLVSLSNSILFSTSNYIQLMQADDKLLSFIEKKQNKDSIYLYKEEIQLVYEGEKDSISSYSVNDNIILVENNSLIEMYDTSSTSPILIKTIAGSSPRIIENNIIYITIDDELNSLVTMDLGSNKISILAVGENIKDFKINNDDSFSYLIKDDPQKINQVINLLYDLNSVNYNDNFINKTNTYNWVKERFIKSKKIIDDISINDNESGFTLNKHVDEGDLIFDKGTFIFPCIIGNTGSLQHIETPNNIYSESNEISLEFKAIEDIKLYVIADEFSSDELLSLGFKETNYPLFTIGSSNWVNINRHSNFKLWTIEVFKNEFFDKSFREYETFTPIILFQENIENLNKFSEWVEERSYSQGDIVLYEGQIYEATSWSDQSPSLGNPWKRLKVGFEILEWDETQVYDTNDLVIFNGYIYNAKWWSNNNSPEDGDPWKCVAADTNPQNWIMTQTYQAGEVIEFENKLYLARWWTVGDSPKYGDPWKEMVLEPEHVLWNSYQTYTKREVVWCNDKKYIAGWYNKGVMPHESEYGVWKIYE